MKILISAAIWITGSILTLAAFIASLFSALFFFPFDRQRRVVHAQCFWLADAIVGLSPFWQLEIKGLENIDRTKTYIIVANHQSMADIIVMYKARLQFKWVAKASLYRVPFIGLFLLFGRHVVLSTHRIGHVKKFYREVADYLNKGMSVFFFPEGTRSPTGDMGPFHSGAFKMAIREKTPILPVFIDGTSAVIRKGSWVINARASASLTVLPPVPTEGLDCGDLACLKEAVYSQLKTLAA